MALEAQEVEERPARETKQAKDLRAEDQQDIRSWLTTIAAGGSFRVKINRVEPKHAPNGDQIDGYLEMVEDERIDEQYVSERWGGGKFQLQIHLPNGRGNWVYGKAITIKIAGPARHQGRVLQETDPRGSSATTGHPVAASALPAGGGANDQLADRALGSAERFALEERRRADRLEEKLATAGRADMDTFKLLLLPLQEQLASMRQENVELRRQAAQPPPTDPFRDRLIERAVDGESQRIQELQRQYDGRLDKLRDDHASELRQLRQSHTDELARAEARHERQADQTTKQHEREIEEMRRAHARELKGAEGNAASERRTIEIAQQARIDNLAAERDRMKAEIVELRAEVGALRKVKDKSLIEQAEDFAKIKTTIEDITGGGGGDEKSPWEKIIGAIGESPAAVTLVERLTSGATDDDDDDDEPQASPQVQIMPNLPPPGKLWQNPADGQVYLHRGGGQMQGPIDVQKLKRLQEAKRKRRPRPGQATAPGPAPSDPAQVAQGDAVEQALADPQDGQEGLPPAADPAVPQLAPAPVPRRRPIPPPIRPAAPRAKVKPPEAKDIKMAVQFMEAALRAGTKPEHVARAARAQVPESTLHYIQQVGADAFIGAVVQQRPGSSLATSAGIRFAREVAQYLFDPPT